MPAIVQPYAQFFDLQGNPLDDGFLYFGTANLNPETNPIAIYWDAALTQPAPQPIRTLSGYVVRSGAPAVIFASGNYSITIKDKNGALIAYEPDSNEYSSIDDIYSDLANTTDIAKGDALVGVRQPISGAKGKTQHQKNAESISILDFTGVTNDGVDSRDGIIAAMIACAAAGVTLFVPQGVYGCRDWIPVPSQLKMMCEPGSKFLLLNDTGPIGGFFIGGYDEDLNPMPFANVEIHNLHLDCNSIIGENAFNAVEADGVRLYNPVIRNTVYGDITASARLGGRAFQFETANNILIGGVNIWNATIEDCSIGINSQGDAAGGASRPAGINYYNVAMRNVDVPFNVDGQYLNFQNVNLANFSTNIEGYTLWNCGRANWPGATSPLVCGIVCGDRGSGLRLRGGRLINEASYGAINSILRGFIYGIDIELDYSVPVMSAVFDFNAVGFGGPSAAATYAWAVGTVRGTGNLDYIVKGSGNGIGPARLNCTVAGTAASLTGLVDSLAASQSPSALCQFTNSDDGITTGLMPPLDISQQGNSFAAWRRVPPTGFVELCHSKLVPNNSTTSFFSAAIPNEGRLSIQYLVTLNYPGSVNDGAVLAMSGIVVGLVDGSGNFTTAVGSNIQSAVATDGVAVQTAVASLTSGGVFQIQVNNDPSNPTRLVTIWARIVLAVNNVAQQPAITYL